MAPGRVAGPQPPFKSGGYRMNERGRHVIWFSRHPRPVAVMHHPAPTQAQVDAARERVQMRKAARRAEVLRARAEREESARREAEVKLEEELKEQRCDTAGLPVERTPKRSARLSTKETEQAMKAMYGPHWRRRMAGPGVVMSTETVGPDGFTQ